MNNLNKIYCGLSVGLLIPLLPFESSGQDRPNVLWLTFEDASYYELGYYGNQMVKTPNIDSLASEGVQYIKAWSVAPQSSPARSSIITGSYATTYGMDLHPVPQNVPQGILFPQFLRDAGYFCSNNSKTHYNVIGDHAASWDECGNKASYNSPKRSANQPFFSVFNCVASHMGRVRTFHTDGRHDYVKEGIDPVQLLLPPHVPDLDEVRSDYAGHLEAIQDIDQWVGFFLKDLKNKGLSDNTIIFVYSDHGGCLPRGKGYLYESGIRVPLIVYFPPKWKHLAQGDVPRKDGKLVNFTDLAPTVLSLASLPTAPFMQGQALFGQYADPKPRNTQVAFATNQLHHYNPVRAITDGRYKYIRSYIPYKQFALRNYYQWGMPSNRAWDKAHLENRLHNSVWQQPFQLRKAEMLFDLEKDPFELNDISACPGSDEILKQFRQQLSKHIRQTKDLGFFTPGFRSVEDTLFVQARQPGFPLNEIYDLVDLVGFASSKHQTMLVSNLSNPNPLVRYWAAVALADLTVRGGLTADGAELVKALSEQNDEVASELALACCYAGFQNEGLNRLLNSTSEASQKACYSILECLSLNKQMHIYMERCVDRLSQDASIFNIVGENEDIGMMARGILVNLGKLPVEAMFGDGAHSIGLKLNQGRRAMLPLP